MHMADRPTPPHRRYATTTGTWTTHRSCAATSASRVRWPPTAARCTGWAPGRSASPACSAREGKRTSSSARCARGRAGTVRMRGFDACRGRRRPPRFRPRRRRCRFRPRRRQRRQARRPRRSRASTSAGLRIARANARLASARRGRSSLRSAAVRRAATSCRACHQRRRWRRQRRRWRRRRRRRWRRLRAKTQRAPPGAPRKTARRTKSQTRSAARTAAPARRET